MKIRKTPLAHLMQTVAGLALSALTCVVAGAAQAQDAGPRSLVVYDQENFAGASKSWTLNPQQPYLLVPFVGAEMNESIASLKLGAEVGVLLFQRPHFASRDDACGPKIGSDANPELWWRGLTADIEPLGYSPAPVERAQSLDTDTSSLILYRRDLGPPPGGLLLERRLYYNRECGNAAHITYFNRIFLPLPEAPARQQCLTLSAPSDSPGAGAKTPKFRRTDELRIMSPARLDNTYAGQRHQLQVELFSGLGCLGDSVGFSSTGGASYQLNDYGFLRKARSARVTYLAGGLDPYFAAAVETPMAAAGISGVATAESEPTAAVSQQTAAQPAALQPSVPSAVAQETTPPDPVAPEPVAPEPVAQEPVAPEPVAQEPVAQVPATPEAVAQEDPAAQPENRQSLPALLPLPEALPEPPPLPVAVSAQPAAAAEPLAPLPEVPAAATQDAVTQALAPPPQPEPALDPAASGATAAAAPQPIADLPEPPPVPLLPQAASAPPTPAPAASSAITTAAKQPVAEQAEPPTVPKSPLPTQAPQSATPAVQQQTATAASRSEAMPLQPSVIVPQTVVPPSSVSGLPTLQPPPEPQLPLSVEPTQKGLPPVPRTVPQTVQPATQPSAQSAALPQRPGQPESGAAQSEDGSPPAEDPAIQSFRYPAHEDYRLNFCYRWGSQCGQPAATAWCKEQGFAGVRSWKRELHVGALFPTIVMGDARICDRFLCDGFEEITCER